MAASMRLLTISSSAHLIADEVWAEPSSMPFSTIARGEVFSRCTLRWAMTMLGRRRFMAAMDWRHLMMVARRLRYGSAIAPTMQTTHRGSSPTVREGSVVHAGALPHGRATAPGPTLRELHMKTLVLLLLVVVSLAGCAREPSKASLANLDALGELRLKDPAAASIKLKQQ